MAFTLNIGKCSLLGNYRENNEDSVEVKQFPDLTIGVVADGMGGQAAGEIASKRAVEIIPRELRKNLSPHLNGEAVRAVIKQAVSQANEEIMAMGALDKDIKNMGTTVVMAVWRKGAELHVAWAGDSRAYLVRAKKIKQLTVDHTIVQALVDAGTISAAEAKEHRYKHVLLKFIGGKDFGDGPDVSVVPIQNGDRILLCTDGLTGAVPDDQICNEMIAVADVQACAEKLGQIALDQGSRDNVSCILIDVVES
jgi:protein phosphatase